MDQPAALGQALAAGAIIDLAEGNLGRARHRVRRAARLLEAAGDSRGSARLLYWQAMECFTGGRLRDAVTRLDRLAHLVVTPGEVLRLWSPRATRGHALVFLARAADGLAEIEETLAWASPARQRKCTTAPKPPTAARCRPQSASRCSAPGRRPGSVPAWPARASPPRPHRTSRPPWRGERRSPATMPGGRTPSFSPPRATTRRARNRRGRPGPGTTRPAAAGKLQAGTATVTATHRAYRTDAPGKEDTRDDKTGQPERWPACAAATGRGTGRAAAAQGAVLRSRRYAERGLPRGAPQGRPGRGGVLQGTVAPRQGGAVHPRGELHRLVLVEGVRQGRHHHLGDPADRLPVHRPGLAGVRAGAARAARRSPGTPTPPPGCATPTSGASCSSCGARPGSGWATRWTPGRRSPATRPRRSGTSRPAARAASSGPRGTRSPS